MSAGVADFERHDAAFDEFMKTSSGFEQLSWREAIGEYEHASARAVAAMAAALSEVIDQG